MSLSIVFSDDDEEEIEMMQKQAAAEAAAKAAESLKELFHAEQSDENFQYKPKYMMDDSPSPENSGEWEVYGVKLVIAYKVVNHANEAQGKVGFALLKKCPNDLKIIIYRTKNEVLATKFVEPTFKMCIKDQYLQFQDDIGFFWSVLTDNFGDREFILKALEGKCEIQREEKPVVIKVDDLDATQDEDDDSSLQGTSNDKACETDPEERQTKQMKANILTRMAKMGKKIVSHQRNSASEVSDSSDTENIRYDPSKKPSLPPRKSTSLRQSTALQKPTPPVVPSAVAVAPPVTVVPVVSSDLVPFTDSKHIIPGHATTVAVSPEPLNMNLLMSMQNTEVRFNLSKLDNKLEKILDKMDFMNEQVVKNERNNSLNRDEEILELEEKLLYFKKENFNLKSKMREMDAVLTLQSMEPNADLLREVELLSKENETIKINNEHISQELGNRLDELKGFKDQFRQQNLLLEQKEQSLKNKEAEMDNLKLVMQEMIELEKENLRLRTENEGLAKAADMSDTDQLIKDIMNNLYYSLCDKIATSEPLSQSEILKIIGQTIKHETNEALKQAGHS